MAIAPITAAPQIMSHTDTNVQQYIKSAYKSSLATFSVSSLSTGGNVLLAFTLGAVAAVVFLVSEAIFGLTGFLYTSKNDPSMILGMISAILISLCIPISLGIQCDFISSIFTSILGSILCRSDILVFIPC